MLHHKYFTFTFDVMILMFKTLYPLLFCTNNKLAFFNISNASLQMYLEVTNTIHSKADRKMKKYFKNENNIMK